MKRQIIIIAIAVLLVGVSSFQTWRVSSELKQQKIKTEQQIALLTLSQLVSDALLEGFTQVDKVYVAQINVPGSSSHLYAFIGGKWFDLGEGQIVTPTDNQTREK